MYQSRPEEINVILQQLALLTEDSSLEYMSKMSNPEFIMESFRKTWVRHSEPKTGLKLFFDKKKKVNENSMTWIDSEINNETKNTDVKDFTPCVKCNSDMKHIMQIDTKDQMFYQDINKEILSVYSCIECRTFRVLRVTKNDPMPEKAYTLNKIEPLSDMIDGINNVPVVDPDACYECGSSIPYKMGEIETNSYKGSKIGGNQKAHITKTYEVEQQGCRCHDVKNSEAIIKFSSYDINTFIDYEILSVVLFKCDVCSKNVVEIFSHDLKLDVKTFMFSDSKHYYHIVTSDNYYNGVVFRTGIMSSTFIACCILDEFKLDEGKISYSKISIISPQLEESLLEHYNVRVNKNTLKKVTLLLRKLIKNQNNDFISIKFTDNIDVKNYYGENFYILETIVGLEPALVKLENENLIFYGNIEHIKYKKKDKPVLNKFIITDFTDTHINIIKEMGGIIEKL